MGHVGRQKPQWTHAFVSSSITRERPLQDTRGVEALAQRVVDAADGGRRLPVDPARHVRDPGRGPDDPFVERREDLAKVTRRKPEPPESASLARRREASAWSVFGGR